MSVKFILNLYCHSLLMLSIAPVSQVKIVWFYWAYLPAILMFVLQSAIDNTALKIAT